MRQEIAGIIVVNKPAHQSSAKVVSQIKRMLHAKKVGHAGTLDPTATGVLICCINEATRLSRFFLKGEKKYEAVLRLGIETDTLDSAGTVIAKTKVPDLNRSFIESIFAGFTGSIQQKPPIYSALKHNGVPLYKLARKGRPVQKPLRQVFISELAIQNLSLPEVQFQVTCSSGTYIRTLCADIGKALGCGGHLSRLTRVESCGFTVEEAISLDEIERLCASGTIGCKIISMNDALKNMQTQQANHRLTDKIRRGIILTRKDIKTELNGASQSFIKIVDENNSLVAVLTHNPLDNQFKYCCVLQN